jgi:hypothetical protein
MRNVIIIAVVCIATLCTAFFAGPFFLLPYYSISGNYRLYSQQNRINNITIGSLLNLTEACRGALPIAPEILFLSVTRLNDLRKRNLTLHAILWTSEDAQHECPEGFEHESEWTAILDQQSTQYRHENDLQCFQWRTKNVSFFDFIRDEWEHNIDYNGPIIQSQYVVHTIWDLSGLNTAADQSIHLQIFLFDFGYARGLKQGCDEKHRPLCDDYFKELVNTTKDVPYQHAKGFCVDDSSCAGVRIVFSHCNDANR